jgi:hypothetical protein
MKSKPLRISAWIAVAFGVFLIFGETRRNWGAWGHWASYTFDYLFAALLVLFGSLSLKGRAWARVLLIVTWVLTIAMLTYSFSGHIRSLDKPTYGPVPHLELTIVIGALDLIALVALAFGIGSFFARKTSRDHPQGS